MNIPPSFEGLDQNLYSRGTSSPSGTQDTKTIVQSKKKHSQGSFNNIKQRLLRFLQNKIKNNPQQCVAKNLLKLSYQELYSETYSNENKVSGVLDMFL